MIAKGDLAAESGYQAVTRVQHCAIIALRSRPPYTGLLQFRGALIHLALAR